MFKHPLVISGIAAKCGLGQTYSDLVQNLKEKKITGFHPYFETVEAANDVGVYSNPFVEVKGLGYSKTQKKVSVHKIIKKNLIKCFKELSADGCLTKQDIQAQDLQVIVAAQANLTDLYGLYPFIEQNDILDNKYYPQLAQFETDSFRESVLMNELKLKFGLAHMPYKVYASSASGQLAIFLAGRLLQREDINKVIVIGWFHPTLQDINFFYQNNILSEIPTVPFSSKTRGVTLASGMAALLMEKSETCHQRQAKPKARFCGIQMKYDQSTGLKFNSLTQTLAKCISSVLKKCQMEPKDIDMVIPHGNGSKVNDENEAAVINKSFGMGEVPVVNYKHQTGYFSAASPIFDVALACDTLINQQVIHPFYPDDFKSTSNLQLIGGGWRFPDQDINSILKIVIGIDGSTSSLVLRK